MQTSDDRSAGLKSLINAHSVLPYGAIAAEVYPRNPHLVQKAYRDPEDRQRGYFN